VEAELTELLDLNQKQIEAMEAAQRKEDKLEDEASLDVYCTVDELRDKVIQFPTLNSTFVRNSINKFDDNVKPVADKRDALQEISLNKVSFWYP
jgi:D-mannonate dehydratase